MPLPALVIANPASAGGRTARRRSSLEARLHSALDGFEIVWTEAPRDGERLAREAARAGVDRIIVAGGDGTASEVVSGVLSAGLGERVELGFLPLGTGGDVFRGLALPCDFDAALRVLQRGVTRCVDAGRAQFRDRGGREATSWFLNEASLGASAVIADGVNVAGKRLGARMAFGLGALRGIARFKPTEVRLRLDGASFFEGPVTFAVAANGPCFGGGMWAAPEARVDDGLFDVVAVPAFGRGRLLRALPGLYTGRYLELPGVTCRRGRHLEAEPGGEIPGPLELDGECLGALPARLEVVPKALRVIAGPA